MQVHPPDLETNLRQREGFRCATWGTSGADWAAPACVTYGVSSLLQTRSPSLEKINII